MMLYPLHHRSAVHHFMPCQAKAAPSIVVANAFRHLQLVRADRKPGSSQERTLNDAGKDPGSRPPTEPGAALRHQFGVSGSWPWIAKKRFRWTCADRMMLLGSAGLVLLPCLICCLLFDLANRSSPSSFFAALLSKRRAASPVMNPQAISSFPTSHALYQAAPSPSHWSFHLHRNQLNLV